MRSDLALLDVAAGHYGRLELITESEISFSFARKMADLARETVDKASLSVEEMSADKSQANTAGQGHMEGGLDLPLDWIDVSAQAIHTTR